MSRKSPWPVALLLVSLLLGPAAAAPAPPSPEAFQPLASLSAAGTAVDWQPRLDDYDRLILTVAGPNGLVIRREFERGSDPSLSLTDKAGQPWPDGDYSYELRLVPKVDESLQQEIRRAREAGNDAQVERLVDSSGLRAARVQGGMLAIRNGGLALPDFAENPAPAIENPASARAGAAEKTAITPPLIVQGGACIGADCSLSETPIELLLKKDQPMITFQDTVGGLFNGDRDWALVANQFGYVNSFSIKDVDAVTIPFNIQADAPDFAMYLRSDGNLGLGTSGPAKDVHLVNASSPTIRLEQTPGALSARTWDLVGNDVGFSIQDVTGSKTPLRVRAAAPTGSFEVAADGSIGFGTTSPSNRLHLFGNAGTNKALIEEASGSTMARELMELRNNGGTYLILEDTNVAQRWSAGTYNSSFILNEQANTAGIELTLTNTGNLTVLGTVTPGSSREIKQGFSGVDNRDVLTRVLAMPITTWAYKADPKVRHMGPMAEDFYSAFQVGADDKGISVTDSAGVALAAIQGLYSVIAEKDVKLEKVALENADLAQRLARLEALLEAPGASAGAAVPAQP